MESYRIVRALCVACAILLAGCSGGGVSIPACPMPQALSVAGFSTGATPAPAPGIPTDSGSFPTGTTFIYFGFTGGTASTNPNQVETMGGIPLLQGNDGSTISGGALAPVESVSAGLLALSGYSASVSGLHPNVNYTITFDPLSSLPFSGFPACSYMKQPGGSFAVGT